MRIACEVLELQEFVRPNVRVIVNRNTRPRSYEGIDLDLPKIEQDLKRIFNTDDIFISLLDSFFLFTYGNFILKEGINILDLQDYFNKEYNFPVVDENQYLCLNKDKIITRNLLPSLYNLKIDSKQSAYIQAHYEI